MSNSLNNSSGQPALAYRLGTYPSFFRDLLSRLHTQALPGSSNRPLAALTTRDPSDPAIALLDAWSLVADVLTFYQERIANEGFLRTATEDRSVLELARMLGYELRPGLAASTALAFTVETAPGMDQIITIAAGLKVQSIPGQDELPQTFETTEALDARPEWNLLRLDPSAGALPSPITPIDTTIPLAGTNTGLSLNERMLITDRWGVRYIPTIRTVTPDYARGSTTVEWARPLGPKNTSLYEPQAIAFRQQAHLFGYNAPPVPNTLKPAEGGVYAFDPQQQTWVHLQAGLPSVEITALSAYTRTNTHYLFAGTLGAGIFRSTDSGKHWQACNTSLTNLIVRALYADSSGYLYAGFENGTIYRSLDNGDSWTQWLNNQSIEHVITNTVTITQTIHSSPVFNKALTDPTKTESTTETWNRLPILDIRALYASSSTIYVGTDDGIFQSVDDGKTWSRFASSAAVRSLVVVSDSLSWNSANTQTISSKHLSALSEPVSTREETSLGERVIRTIGLGTAQKIWIGTNDGLFDGNRALLPRIPGVSNDIRVLCMAPSGLVFAAVPLGQLIETDWPGFYPTNQNAIDLDAYYPQAMPDGWVLLLNGSNAASYRITAVATQSRTDFNLIANVTRLTLDQTPDKLFFGEHLRGTTALIGSEPVPIYPQPAPLTGNQIVLDRPIPALPSGRRMIISDQQQGRSEVITVSQMVDQQTIIIREQLAKSYGSASTVIMANVVLATHGETIMSEVLGSGDGTLANQQFLLKHAPLTYLPAAGDSGDQAQLQVWVNDILWSEAAALNQLDQHSQSYVVRRNADQQTRIIFGDGVHGARLPSGQENIVATYRVGLGPQGRVNANSLSLLQTRPLGVQSVDNPLAASGAATPESSASARMNAALTALTMDRVVALADYEHFVRSYAGIGAVQAALLWAGDTRLIHLTVADADGNTLPAGVTLLAELRAALDRRRNRRQPLSIASYQPLNFSISLILFVDPHYKPALVQADVEQALLTAFSFRKRNLAQPIYAAEVIAVAQATPGVVAVDLDALFLSTAEKSLSPILVASPAHWDALARRVMAAELLVLDQITLQTQVAS